MPNRTLVIRLAPSVDAVPDLLDRLEAYAEETGVPPKTAYRLAVVCEELAANVAIHGAAGEGAATYVEIRVGWEDPGRLRLSIEDDGLPFDPLSLDAPDLTAELEEREIGGLGIHFVRTLAQEITYVRQDDRNRLTAFFDIVE